MARTGRPPHKPTAALRRRVRDLVLYGITEESIARIIGLNPETLRKYYAHEIATGKDTGIAEVAAKLHQQALKGNTTAMIFFLKARGGWKDTHDVPLTTELLDSIIASQRQKLQVGPSSSS